jgi:hypothetical protein
MGDVFARFIVQLGCASCILVGHNRGQAHVVLSGVANALDLIFVTNFHVSPSDPGAYYFALHLGPFKTPENQLFIARIAKGIPHCPNDKEGYWPQAN